MPGGLARLVPRRLGQDHIGLSLASLAGSGFFSLSHSTNYLSLLLNPIEETFLQHVFRNLALLLLHIQCLHFQGLCRINLRNGQYSHANNIL